MSDQKPSVGRIVHYVSHGPPVRNDGSQAFTSECRAAVITAVKSDTEVDLFVMNPTGVFLNQGCEYDGRDGEVYVAGAERRPHRGGTWHWPERV